MISTPAPSDNPHSRVARQLATWPANPQPRGGASEMPARWWAAAMGSRVRQFETGTTP